MSSSMMTTAVLGLSLTAASAMAHPPRSLQSISKINDFIAGGGPPSSSETVRVNVKKSRESAGSSCAVKTSAEAFSDGRSDYISAVVDAYKTSCDYWNYEEFYSIVYGWAYSFSAAVAEVDVECASFATEAGFADACGLGEAAARASNAEFVSAHADATAEVVNSPYCSCTKQEVWTNAHANLFQKITTQAWARAKAAACVEGNDFAKAEAYISCYAHVWTDLFAKATAEIYIDSGCYAFDEAIEAEVIAFVDAHSTEVEVCREVLNSIGDSRSVVDGDATTTVNP